MYPSRDKGTIANKAQHQLARLFGLSRNDEEGWLVDKKDPFHECDLWGLRELDGTA
jgi:hypothetical protein